MSQPGFCGTLAKRLGFAAAVLVTTAPISSAATLTTLHSVFGGEVAHPSSGLVMDRNGLLYGTSIGSPYGSVYKFDPNNPTAYQTPVVRFQSFDGSFPQGTLYLDTVGSLYGATNNGGPNSLGTIFKIANDSAQTHSILSSFNGNYTPGPASNGYNPRGRLLADAQGYLYGTTLYAGTGTNHSSIFRIAKTGGPIQTLGLIPNNNGIFDVPGLTRDPAGNFYAVSPTGGGWEAGSIHRMANDGSFSLQAIATFNGTNGAYPAGELVADAQGNLYGTTYGGYGSDVWGSVFKIANDASNTLTTLASFNGINGSRPQAGLIIDAAGNLFGTTRGNGTSNRGSVFRIANDDNRTLSVLATFTGPNGGFPDSELMADSSGRLYGVTPQGGQHNNGTIFRIDGAGFVVPEPLTLGVLLFLLPKRKRQ